MSVLLGLLVATLVILAIAKNPLYLVFALALPFAAITFGIFSVILCIYLGYQKGVPHSYSKAYLLFSLLLVFFSVYIRL